MVVILESALKVERRGLVVELLTIGCGSNADVTLFEPFDGQRGCSNVCSRSLDALAQFKADTMYG